MSAENPSDRELVHRVLEGDRSSFDEIVRRHSQYVYLTAVNILKNPEEAKDVMQDVFLLAWIKLDCYLSRLGEFRSWLTGITLNQIRNHCSARTREARLRAAYRVVQIVSSHRPTSAIGLLLDEQLVRLPHEFRVVFVLFQWFGFSYQEIAEIIDRPIGTVMSRLYRSRQSLLQ